MYKALKQLKVQTEDGKIEIRNPGDIVPEADDWPNLQPWISKGFIAPMDQETSSKHKWNRKKIKPARNSTEDDIARGKGSIEIEKDKLNQNDEEKGYNEKRKEHLNMVEQKGELLSLSRADLDALALERNLDPQQYSNKNLLVDALLNA